MEKMVLISGLTVTVDSIHTMIHRLINKTYKLLPMREEGQEWIKSLEIIIEQVEGLKRLIEDQDNLFILILCKLKGLFSLNQDKDMNLYRRVIFECLNLLNDLDSHVCIR